MAAKKEYVLLVSSLMETDLEARINVLAELGFRMCQAYAMGRVHVVWMEKEIPELKVIK